MTKKEWSEKMVKAWKHRIEQYRYAIRKGRYGRLFEGECGICLEVFKVYPSDCAECPFAMSPTARRLYYVDSDRIDFDEASLCLSKNRKNIEDFSFDRERLEARLREIIKIGRETGVIT